MRRTCTPPPRIAALAPLAALLLGGCLELGGSFTPSGTTTATETSEGSASQTSTSSATADAGSSTTAGQDTDADTTGTTGPAPLVCSFGQILRCVENDDGQCGPESTCVDPEGCDPRSCGLSGEFNFTGCDEVCGDGYACAPSDDDGILRCVYDPAMFMCSTWDQNCPEGHKCTIWANNGGGSWNATKCVPIPPRPKQLGEPCTFTGDVIDGEDDCDRGLYCWDVDWETQLGACTPFCTGSEQDAMCPLGYLCAFGFQRTGLDASICSDGCDLLAQDCAGDDLCLPLGDDDFPGCVLDASGDAGAYADPCEYENSCDPGLICVGGALVPKCEAESCCTPMCDLNAPNTCPGDGQVCAQLFDPDPELPQLEHIGVCALQE
jgi:hypothetical protein